MAWLQTLLLFIGIGMLAWGYVSRERNRMLVAALALFLAPAGPDFIAGVIEGYQRTMREHAQAGPPPHATPPAARAPA